MTNMQNTTKTVKATTKGRFVKHNVTTFRPITDKQVLAKLRAKGDKTAKDLKTSGNHLRHLEARGLVLRSGHVGDGRLGGPRSVRKGAGRPAVIWRAA